MPRNPDTLSVDALIVGGGPAGLSAALVLARCTRSVLVIDAGRPRNYAARAMHNFLTRDGIAPAEFLERARREVIAHGVTVLRDHVTVASCRPGGFDVRTGGGRSFRTRTLLLATGVVDDLPPLKNLPAFYGLGVHHCPYCDGWSYRGQPLAAIGDGDAGLGMAMNLLTWSKDVTVLTNGDRLSAKGRRTASQLGIVVRAEPIDRLLSRKGRETPGKRDPLGRVRLTSGPDVEVSALFFNTDKVQRSQLPVRLGCRMDEHGGVMHDKRQRTGVNGLFLAGDASMDVQFVIVAAAEGAKAGLAMNRFMQDADRARVLNAGRTRPARRS